MNQTTNTAIPVEFLLVLHPNSHFEFDHKNGRWRLVLEADSLPVLKALVEATERFLLIQEEGARTGPSVSISAPQPKE